MLEGCIAEGLANCGHGEFIRDNRPIPDLSAGGVVAYVDNVLTLSTDSTVSEKLILAINDVLKQKGLLVHDVFINDETTVGLG